MRHSTPIQACVFNIPDYGNIVISLASVLRRLCQLRCIGAFQFICLFACSTVFAFDPPPDVKLGDRFEVFRYNPKENEEDPRIRLKVPPQKGLILYCRVFGENDDLRWILNAFWGPQNSNYYTVGPINRNAPWTLAGRVYRPVEFKPDFVVMESCEIETQAGLAGTPAALIVPVGGTRVMGYDSLTFVGGPMSWKTGEWELESSFDRYRIGAQRSFMTRERSIFKDGDILTVPIKIDYMGRVMSPERKYKLERIVKFEGPKWPTGWAVFEPVKPAADGAAPPVNGTGTPPVPAKLPAPTPDNPTPPAKGAATSPPAETGSTPPVKPSVPR